MVSVSALPVIQAAADSKSSQPKTPIKHVIEIMMENHTFDNLFGIYPNDPNGSNATLESGISRPVNLLNPHSDLSGLKAVPSGTFSTPDPVEGYTAYHIDWNWGRMNGFMNGSGPESMTYYTSSQVAPEWIIAQEYAMDQSDYVLMTESNPNRLYNLAGYSPVVNDYGPAPYIPYSQSVLSELDHYSISWKYFVKDKTQGYEPLNYFWGINQHLSNIGSWADFTSEVENGTLPSVSWLMPISGGAPAYYAQGPPAEILAGEMWIVHALNLLMHSSIWNSTAVFITYDDAGGYYDQVSPPVIDGIQMGERVPFILVSPYAKENYISSTVLDQGSVPAFIDYNWNIPALNGFVSKSGIPLDMFDFSQKYGSLNYTSRPPIDLPCMMGSQFSTPSSLSFPEPSSTGLNFSSIFPAKFQIPLDEVPYSENGSTNYTLSGGALYVQQNTPFTPFYETGWFIVVLLAATMAISVWLPYMWKRRKAP